MDIPEDDDCFFLFPEMTEFRHNNIGPMSDDMTIYVPIDWFNLA